MLGVNSYSCRITTRDDTSKRPDSVENRDGDANKLVSPFGAEARRSLSRLGATGLTAIVEGFVEADSECPSLRPLLISHEAETCRNEKANTDDANFRALFGLPNLDLRTDKGM